MGKFLDDEEMPAGPLGFKGAEITFLVFNAPSAEDKESFL